MKPHLFKYNHPKYKRKSSVWKREKDRRRAHNVYKLGFAAFAGLVGIFLVTHAVSLTKSLSFLVKPGEGNHIVSGRTNIIVDYGAVALISIDNQNNTVDAFVLPKGVYVQAPFTQGKYRLSALYEMTELQEKGKGGEALVKAAQDIFGMPVDGYVKVKEPLDANTITAAYVRKEIAGVGFFYSLVSTQGFEEKIHTNLSMVDMMRLWWQAKSVRFDKFVVHDFTSQNGLRTMVLADGSKVLSVSEDLLDSSLAEIVKDPLIEKENMHVEVVNASEVSGVGSEYSRIITNLGAQVVRVESAPAKEQGSSIIVGKEVNADQLVNRLSKFRKFTIIEAQNDAPDQLGNVRVILGVQ